jgi:hypothetical protein
MAAAANTFSPDDRPPPSMADSPTLSAQYQQFGTDNTKAVPRRSRQHLDGWFFNIVECPFSKIGVV